MPADLPPSFRPWALFVQAAVAAQLNKAHRSLHGKTQTALNTLKQHGAQTNAALKRHAEQLQKARADAETAPRPMRSAALQSSGVGFGRV